MNWKDTFLSNGKLLEIYGTPAFTERQGREKQAEVSFKAGQEDVILESKMGTLTVSSLVKKGRREVVEWILANSNEPWIGSVFDYEEWQAKLKEWGI